MSALEHQCPKQYDRLLRAGAKEIRIRGIGSRNETILEGRFECQECHSERWVSGLSAGVKTKNTRGRCCGVKPGIRRLRDGGFIGKIGPENQNWKGGKSVRKDGYVLISVPVNSEFAAMGTKRSAGHVQIFEHRLVMAKQLGRPLRSEEIVHHIDGNTSNNLIENLQLIANKSAHTALEQQIIKNRISRLESENGELRKENEELKCQLKLKK